MDERQEQFILELLAGHNTLTLATVREDGWPQATTVAYANEALDIFVATFPESQKVRNIRRDNRVSVTIDRDYEDWTRIKGLSMAAYAEIVADDETLALAEECFSDKFPQLQAIPLPEPFEVTMLRLTPKVISILDYEKAFGHTELVTL